MIYYLLAIISQETQYQLEQNRHIESLNLGPNEIVQFVGSIYLFDLSILVEEDDNANMLVDPPYTQTLQDTDVNITDFQ